MDGERGCAVPWSQQDGLNLEPGGLDEPGVSLGTFWDVARPQPGVVAGGRVPKSRPSPSVLRAQGCSSPFKAGQQLVATCALRPLRHRAPRLGWLSPRCHCWWPPRRMSAGPAGTAWGRCHHAGGG